MRRRLRPEAPRYLSALNNLALSSGQTERLPEAIALQEQSLAIMRRVLPPNHPISAFAMGNVAELYEKSGRGEEEAKLRAELMALKEGNEAESGVQVSRAAEVLENR